MILTLNHHNLPRPQLDRMNTFLVMLYVILDPLIILNQTNPCSIFPKSKLDHKTSTQYLTWLKVLGSVSMLQLQKVAMGLVKN